MLNLLFLIITCVWAARYIETFFIERRDPFRDLASEGPSLEAPSPPPLVSVLIPARNEERSIGRALDSILAQDYPNFEIIVIDDRSTDRTPDIIKSYIDERLFLNTNSHESKTESTRIIDLKDSCKFDKNSCEFVHKKPIKYVRLDSVPEGYAGKSYALYQGAMEAKGEWLLFTDADTVHNSFCLRASLSYAISNKQDMLSLISHPESITFWEKTCQPLVGAILLTIYPMWLVNNPRSKFAFANGQFILIRHEAYKKIRGHEALLRLPLEDVNMARNAKAAGLKFKLTFGNRLFMTRMYRGLNELWVGWTRSFYLMMGRNFLYPLMNIAGLCLFSILPYIGLFLFPNDALPAFIFLHLALERGYRIFNMDRRYIFTHLLGSAVMVGILMNVLLRKLFRLGVLWKETRYRE